MLSAALTFGLYIVGHFSGDLRNFQHVVDSPAAAPLRARALLGAAEPGAVRRQERTSSTASAVPLGYIAMTVAYAALYIAMLLAISMFVFSRRDFK